MNRIALKMLFNDRVKFLQLVFTVAFVSFLLTQQVCVFIGIMARTTSQIREVKEANIWVADPATQYVEEIQPLSDTDLYRVRSSPGVEWAVPFFKSLAILRAEDGRFRSSLVLGLDDSSLIGGPQHMLMGTITDLNQPNAIIMDKAGYYFFYPNEPFELGKVFELNDHRAVLVGICDAQPPFQTVPVIYAKYSDAIKFVGLTRRQLSFILAKSKDGLDPWAVCQSIDERTGLRALPQEAFMWQTIIYYLKNTGIAINFGLTIIISIIVGMVVGGQTFYLFIIENLKYFATLKAIGLSHKKLIKMVLLQASTVGTLGYCFGMGLAGFFFKQTENNLATRGLILRWESMLGTGLVVLLIVTVVSVLSLRRVIRLEPATVFRS